MYLYFNFVTLISLFNFLTEFFTQLLFKIPWFMQNAMIIGMTFPPQLRIIGIILLICIITAIVHIILSGRRTHNFIQPDPARPTIRKVCFNAWKYLLLIIFSVISFSTLLLFLISVIEALLMFFR